MLDQSGEKFVTQLQQNSPNGNLPWAGQWELTCRCNLKCVMCYTDCFNTPERIREELKTSEILRILHEIREAGCMELTFTGGEPLSRPDFLAIYDEAHKLGFLITVFTNGTLITRALADHWAVLRPQSVEISMHGFSSEVFDGVTQVRGSLARCLEGIKLLLERRIPLVLKTVGLDRNHQEILAIKHYAESLGAGVKWRFGQYLRDDLSLSSSPYRFQLPEETLLAIEKQDPELWKAKCEEITKSESLQGLHCGGGKGKFHIDAYGGLQLCSNNRRESYDLKHGSFRDGFYRALPEFPCPRRNTEVAVSLQTSNPR